jgi:tRNA nucleotidyltransferase (CCA-adding enzyme)
MTMEVETFRRSATFGEARRRIATGRHGAYPIVDGGRLVGIVARGDVLRDDCDDDQPLVEHAASQVVTVSPADTAQTALRVMVDEHVEHVPVVDADRVLVGICTRTDLLKVRRGQLELERRQDGIAARFNGSARRDRRPKETQT